MDLVVGDPIEAIVVVGAPSEPTVVDGAPIEAIVVVGVCSDDLVLVAGTPIEAIVVVGAPMEPTVVAGAPIEATSPFASAESVPPAERIESPIVGLYVGCDVGVVVTFRVSFFAVGFVVGFRVGCGVGFGVSGEEVGRSDGDSVFSFGVGGVEAERNDGENGIAWRVDDLPKGLPVGCIEGGRVVMVSEPCSMKSETDPSLLCMASSLSRTISPSVILLPDKKKNTTQMTFSVRKTATALRPKRLVIFEGRKPTNSIPCFRIEFFSTVHCVTVSNP